MHVRNGIVQDTAEKKNLGTIQGPAEEVVMNEVPKHQGLAPMQMAIVRMIVAMVSIQDSRVIVYSKTLPIYWPNIEDVLKRVYDIKTAPPPGDRTVTFIEDNSLVPIVATLDEVTHIIVSGKVSVPAHYNLATRTGKIIRLVASSK
jgi:hypothetical protein